MKKIKTVFIAAVFSLLLLMGILTFALPDTGFSENENRVPAQKPALTLSSLADGSFGASLSDYLSDQIPMRQGMIRIETRLKLLLGRRDISGAYIGKDHYFFEKVTDNDIDMIRYERNLSFFEQLSEENPSVSFNAMLVPSSGVILEDRLPYKAQMYDAERLYLKAEEILSSCNVVNPTSLLMEASEEYIYYRTDHHWTTRGAYLGYLALNGSGEIYSMPELEAVSADFYGTLYSKASGADAIPDTIELLPVDSSVKVTVNGESSALYDMSALSVKDKYSVFFGGNFSRIDIEGNGERTILVIKDSFANCMIPFLLDDYGTVTVIDLRYTSESVRSLLSQGGYDEVLLLYELNNFAQDANIGKLLL
jgi:hypothetical protein